jgi:hypothetical protein
VLWGIARLRGRMFDVLVGVGVAAELLIVLRDLPDPG